MVGARSRHKKGGQESGSRSVASQHSSQVPGGYPPQLDGPASNAGSAGAAERARSTSRDASQSREHVPRRLGPSDLNRNVELGADAYHLLRNYDSHSANMIRPGFCTSGKELAMRVNSHRVNSVPTRPIYQFDVTIGKGEDEKRGLLMAVWKSNELKKQLSNGGQGWLFDGNKLAWCLNPMPDGPRLSTMVDLDKEKGRPGGDGRNTFRVVIRQTKLVDMSALQSYLENKCGFTNEVLEAINFLDHLLRQTPSEKLLAIKRSFFDKTMAGMGQLQGGVIALKGIYQSLRCAQGGRLVINADVSNSCFWVHGNLQNAALALGTPSTEFQLCPGMEKPPRGGETKLYVNMQKLRKIRVTINYKGASEKTKSKVFQVEAVLRTNARNTFFDSNEENGDLKKTSVYDYFMQRYGHRIERPHLPCVKMSKGQLYPMDLCTVVKGQRYPYRLNEFQTSQMIKFAVTKPSIRAEAIQGGLNALNWAGDPYLKNYGMSINPTMLETKARLLNPPVVEFAGGKCEKPGLAGRWRIDGKQFIKPNKDELSRWGVMVFNDWAPQTREKIGKADVDKFIQEFIKEYKAYGGKIKTTMPTIMVGTQDIGGSIEKLFNAVNIETENATFRPQLLVFIVNAKITQLYNRVKKNCDCRFGVASQVMQAAHIKKCSAQYIGNVLLKVNAKLGGFAFRANPSIPKPGSQNVAPKWFPKHTIIVGCDVSHPGAGSLRPSLAAMTVSMDGLGCRYAAACQTNGYRSEMVSTWNCYDMLSPLFREWMSTVGEGRFPTNLLYFRDGVSEGQHQHVLKQEIRDIKGVWQALDQSPGKKAWMNIKFTVVIASKRHHIRFFPKQGSGDKNGNAQPGTLVERDVTSPREYDFYLCSHNALQGTARPVHYHVLQDDANIPVNEFINLVYCHSYQYARSSTPVSLFPAVYYAHLASNRAAAHDRNDLNDPVGNFHYTPHDLSDLAKLEEAKAECDRTGKIMTSGAVARLKQLQQLQYPTLIPLGQHGRLNMAMWYI